MFVARVARYRPIGTTVIYQIATSPYRCLLLPSAMQPVALIITRALPACRCQGLGPPPRIQRLPPNSSGSRVIHQSFFEVISPESLQIAPGARSSFWAVLHETSPVLHRRQDTDKHSICLCRAAGCTPMWKGSTHHRFDSVAQPNPLSRLGYSRRQKFQGVTLIYIPVVPIYALRNPIQATGFQQLEAVWRPCCPGENRSASLNCMPPVPQSRPD
jgi:hypothetical protein